MKTNHSLLAVVISLFISLSLFAQAPYKLPPQEVIDIVEAPPTPRASLSPGGNFLLLTDYESMPDIATMSQPLLRIAGMRITPNTHSSQRTSFNTGFLIKALADRSELRVKVRAGAKLGEAKWSDNDKWLAFPQYSDTGVSLWLANTKTGDTKLLLDKTLNMTVGNGFLWLPDNRHILAYTIPEERGAPPAENRVPTGPTIQATTGKVSKVRTYQDLLTNVHDEKLFDFYTTSQLVVVNIASGQVKKINTPGIYASTRYSPDGEYLLVNRIKRPYSYMVTYRSFAHAYEVWDRQGRLVHTIADLPLAEEVPLHGVAKGPRQVSWRALAPATLTWAEALDEGDPEKEVKFRDRLMMCPAPFKRPAQEIVKVKKRFSSLSWLEEKGLALLADYDWKERWQTVTLFHVDDTHFEPKVLFDLSTQDRYADPGRAVYKKTASGESVVRYEDDSIFLSGSGASPEGDRPFLDKLHLVSMEKDRLFHCQPETYESFVDFMGNSDNRIITRYESKTDVPNYYIFDMDEKARKPLTAFKDPAPQLTGIQKELIKYTRDDGVELSGTLYLPPGYKKGERLPLVVWAYPREFSNARVAGQIRGSSHRFTYYRGYSQLFFLTQGYALLDNAQMPVIGDPETMNDTFVQQIVASAKAAIDKLDDMGIVDPNRVGVGGHSYGAFMTANLLAHCDLFSAGIARSGAYNRTLTPFGFQSERRTFWEVPDIYFKLSPFMHANKVNEPILLIHGELDNNSGTFPIQSKRFYHAIKGHGATARLVMLPNESHGYRARESVLHVLAEMFDWFDEHVKNRK